MENNKYYYSSDCAGITAKNFSAYYGYEVTQLRVDPEDDEDVEWCFEAKFNNEIIIIPFSKLGTEKNNEDDCKENLLQGIAWILTKYKLTI